jgi:DNA-binding IscR family transcriptional regulator
MVRLLVQNGLLAETAGKEGCYILLKAPAALRVKEIVDMVIQEGAKPETLGLANLDAPVANILTKMEAGVAGSLEGMTIQDLLQSKKANGEWSTVHA